MKLNGDFRSSWFSGLAGIVATVELNGSFKDEKAGPSLQSVEATRVVAENFFDRRRRYAFLAPHHTHHTVFFGLILVAVIRAHDYVVFANVTQEMGEAFVRLGGNVEPVVAEKLRPPLQGWGAEIGYFWIGRNFGRLNSGVTSSQATSTRMPISTSFGSIPTTLLCMRTPSSSSMMAST